MNKFKIFEILWLLIPGFKLKNILRIILFKLFNKLAVTPKTTVKKGSTVLLVGIHLTKTVESWIDAVGVNGHLIVVEASRESYKKVKQEILGGKVDNVIFQNIAAWNEQGMIKLEIGDRPGSTKVRDTRARYTPSFLDEGNIYYTDEIQIASDKLDNVLNNIGIKKVDHIQLNINGSEIEAIEGLEKTIKLYKPSFSIKSETNLGDGEIPTSDVVLKTLEEKNYYVICKKYMPKGPDRIFAIYL